MTARTSPIVALDRTALLLALAASAALAACSSDSDDDSPTNPTDTTAPTASSFIQDRTTDATGQTIAVTFSEEVTSATAELATNYTVTGGANVVSATLRPNDTVVDLVLDALAIPGTHTISIAGGIEDAAGNTSAAINASTITSTDTAAPAASSVAGATVSGAENDTITVVFDDNMIESEVESVANWTIESPLGTTFDITGATVDYDDTTRTATVTLGAGSADQNLGTGDDVHASFTTMRDIAGNTVTATAIGSTAVNGQVQGDALAPALLSATPGAGNTVVLVFDEAIQDAETLDLLTVPNPTGTEFTLTDASDPGVQATGTIELTGTPVDGDSITISDGTTSQEFEFDVATGSISLSANPNDTDSITISDGTTSLVFEFESGGGISGDVSVAIDAAVATTVTNLITAINGAGFDMTAAAGATANDIDLTNDTAPGASANVTITGTDSATVQTLVGMTGGGITGDVGVAVDQSSDAGTVTLLRAAIDGNGFNVETLVGTAGTDFIVRNTGFGTSGNVTITESDSGGAITIAGMTGGVDAGVATFEPTASAGSGTDQATVTYTVAPAALDDLRIWGVRDLAGNQMTPETAFAVATANASDPVINAATITAVTGDGNDQIVIDFDLAMSPEGLTDPANYTLADGSGPVDISGATGEMTGASQVTFTLPSGADIQSAETYTVTANNVTSAFGVTRSSADTEAGVSPGGDSAAPSVGVGNAQIDAQDAMSLLITFDEAVGAGAAVAANYTIAGNTTTAAQMVTPEVARVTFQSAPAVADNVDVAVAALTDLAGNAAVGVATVAVTAADSTAPTVTAVAGDATAGEKHSIAVTFDEQVMVAEASNVANYAAMVQGGAAVSLTDATVRFDSNSGVATIELAEGTYIPNGATLDVTVSGVNDVSGNTIVAAAVSGSVAGDAVAPTTAVAFPNLKEEAAGMTLQVVFPEPMDSAATTATGSWTGSGGQTATAVVALNSTTYLVSMDGAIDAAGGETLDVATPTDAAGNVGAAINIAPIQ